MAILSGRTALLLWLCGFCIASVFGAATNLNETFSVSLAQHPSQANTTNSTYSVEAEEDHETKDEEEEEETFEDAEMFEIQEEDIVFEKDDDNESFIELNPSYVGPPEDVPDDNDESDNDDDDSESESESEDEEDQEKDTSMKHKRNKALARSTRTNATQTTTATAKKQIRRAGKVTLRFLRKHQGSLMAAAFVFAFRKEIKHFVVKAFTRPVIDPETGEIRRKLVRLTATDALKLILFLDLMRRFMSSNTSSNADDASGQQHSSRGASQLPATLALLLLKGGMLGPFSLLLLPLLLSKPQSTIYLPPVVQHYTFETLNHRFSKDGMALQRALGVSNSENLASSSSSSSSFPTSYKSLLSSVQAKASPMDPKGKEPTATPKPTYNGTTVLLDMTKLDTSVSQIGVIRDKVSFLLKEYTSLQSKNASLLPGDGGLEVAVLLESPGGSAPDYALAAEQLLRLRKLGFTVTVLVDKVAASGGYMIACTSSPGRLFAAPFAILGSIGVVGQAVNIQKTLEAYGVQALVFRGGRDKAPLGLLGDITEEAIEKVQDMVETTHRAFKRHVVEARPILAHNIEQVATGDTFLGYDALNVGLVDGIISSDEYISQRIKDGALVLKLLQIKRPRKSLFHPSTEGDDLESSMSWTGGLRGVSSFLGRTSQFLQRAQSLADRMASLDHGPGGPVRT